MRGIWVAAAGVLVAAIAACSDAVTNPGATPSRPSFVDGFQLETVAVTTCQYGGEYPNCKPKPPEPGGTTPTTSPATGGASGGGGGGGTGDNSQPPDSTQTTCDPRNDPDCEQPLTSTDSTTILNAINNFVRSDAEIADTVTRRRCREMRDRFLASFNSGMVFRGGSNTTGAQAHYGATIDQRIHFDPWALDAAMSSAADQRELANTALHEAAHVLGFTHPSEADANGIYTDVPFNLLPPGPGPCLK
jgi:hypothetical protein